MTKNEFRQTAEQMLRMTKANRDEVNSEPVQKLIAGITKYDPELGELMQKNNASIDAVIAHLEKRLGDR